MIWNEKIESASRSHLHAIQSERLVNAVKHVYNSIPAYRLKMQEKSLLPSDIKSIKDISKLPFTNKSDLRENYPFGMFAVPMTDIVRVHASSEQFFSDEIRELEALRKKITDKIQSVLGISINVKLVEPKIIERSSGKAKRVIDNRKI